MFHDQYPRQLHGAEYCNSIPERPAGDGTSRITRSPVSQHKVLLHLLNSPVRLTGWDGKSRKSRLKEAAGVSIWSSPVSLSKQEKCLITWDSSRHDEG